jgi:GNAT superfamily N-acetyltransferase
LNVSFAEPENIRRLFDEQVRQGIAGDEQNIVTTSRHVVRSSARGDVGWSEVSWSDLDDANSSDVIEEQIDYFAARGLSFVWKVYEGDLPHDLGARLLAASFQLLGRSELMIAKVSDVSVDVDLPTGVSLVSANDPEGIDRLIEVHETVFQHDHSVLRRTLLAQLESSPDRSERVVAIAGGVPVSSARVEFLPDREFASLWGGSTLSEWRGKGLYRAMVAYRAKEAAERGYTYLFATASIHSRPILERLNFRSFGTVSAYEWKP